VRWLKGSLDIFATRTGTMNRVTGAQSLPPGGRMTKIDQGKLGAAEAFLDQQSARVVQSATEPPRQTTQSPLLFGRDPDVDDTSFRHNSFNSMRPL